MENTAIEYINKTKLAYNTKQNYLFHFRQIIKCPDPKNLPAKTKNYEKNKHIVKMVELYNQAVKDANTEEIDNTDEIVDSGSDTESVFTVETVAAKSPRIAQKSKITDETLKVRDCVSKVVDLIRENARLKDELRIAKAALLC